MEGQDDDLTSRMAEEPIPFLKDESGSEAAPDSLLKRGAVGLARFTYRSAIIIAALGVLSGAMERIVDNHSKPKEDLTLAEVERVVTMSDAELAMTIRARLGWPR